MVGDGPRQPGCKPSGLVCHRRLGHYPVAGGLLWSPHKQGNDMTICFLSFLKLGVIIHMKVLCKFKVFFFQPYDGLVMFAECMRKWKTDQPCRNKFPLLPEEGQHENPESHEENWSQWFHEHHPKNQWQRLESEAKNLSTCQFHPGSSRKYSFA